MDSSRVVVGAAILRDGAGGVEVLAAQRGLPAALAGGWEFVGGKVEVGEDDIQALRRECREEIGVGIDVDDRVGPDVEIPATGYLLRVWTARIIEGVPRSTEHQELRWLGLPQLYDVAWLPADLPIVAALQQILERS